MKKAVPFSITQCVMLSIFLVVRPVESVENAARFLYLNRHCFNGLCRYNRRGEFNVPFGKYKKPYFPADEIRAFAEKAKRATFITAHYSETLDLVRDGNDVVYCDPPYLTESDNFTAYHERGTGLNMRPMKVNWKCVRRNPGYCA